MVLMWCVFYFNFIFTFYCLVDFLNITSPSITAKAKNIPKFPPETSGEVSFAENQMKFIHYISLAFLSCFVGNVMG